jgi:flagellin
MGMRITTNLPSITAQRSLAGSQRAMNTAMSQLASGSRITKSADDAAGLAISENLKSHIRGYGQAQRNANDGISMVQVAEGGLNEISNIITRFRELGVQAASDSVGDTERGFINNEVQQLVNEAQRIAQSTRFGKTQLIDGTGGRFDFQIDVMNDDFNDRIGYDSSEINATTSNLGIDGLDFSSREGAREALAILDDAQTQVNGYRANLGAIQNRLASTSDNIGVAVENLSAANSRIRDADVAASSADMAKNQILLQGSTAVLAQANQQPAMALKLVG